jgi:tripartite-type tricarboxylate transporter receptor subunit TctC
MHRRTFLLSAAAALVAAPGRLAAQQGSFPNRPITFVVPFAPGGGTDVITRLIADKLGEAIGQRVVVENRPGAAGAVANRAVISAPADGHTILMGTAGTQAASLALNPNLGFDTRSDLLSIAHVGATPNLLVVHPGVPARSVADFVALARAQPATIPYASSGTGTISHLSGALFERMAGIRLTHVPYRGAGPANNDLVAGQVQAMFDSPISLLPLVQGGRIRALAVTSAERLPALPDVPTMREAGFPDYLAEIWLGVFAPRNTPPEIARRLEAAILAATALPEIQTRMRQLGFEPRPASGQVMARALDEDLTRWTTTVREAGIKPE